MRTARGEQLPFAVQLLGWTRDVVVFTGGPREVPAEMQPAASYALLDFFVCRLESAFGLQDAPRAELDALLRESVQGARSRGDAAT